MSAESLNNCLQFTIEIQYNHEYNHGNVTKKDNRESVFSTFECIREKRNRSVVAVDRVVECQK